MTSELREDNLKGSTTGGSINVLGEGTSATTNLQQGLGKFWSNWDGESTVATRDSFNQSGLTDNGTGDYTTAFTSNMSNDDYAHLCTCDSADGHILEIEREAYDTTSMAIDTSGQVSVRGEGSATTTNLQQGLAKCWLRADMNTENDIQDSLNTASVTDQSTGDTRWNFTNALANTNGVMSGATARTGNPKLSGSAGSIALSTSQFRVMTTNHSGSTEADTEWGALAHGDLA